jgi:7-carboxy-7-deazaguanine synthase
MKGRIAEIFLSIQGEGLYVGERQVFVRLADCNLDCRYCDTRGYSFREYEPQSLIGELSCYRDNYKSVAFTGGEPLVQKDFLKEILALTHEAGFNNYLETNGTLAEALEEVIDNVDIVAMDFKFPSSTGQEGFWPQHRKFLKIASRKEVFIKSVICASTLESDLREAVHVIKEVNPGAILVLQPDSSADYFDIEEKIKRFKYICISENIAVCIIPQIHKLVGVK